MIGASTLAERPDVASSDLAAATADRATVLCVSNTFATDRILFYSSFFNALRDAANLSVWSYGPVDPRFPADHPVARCFSVVPTGRSFPFALTLARHFNNYLWDHTGQSASRLSMWTLRTTGRLPVRQRLLWRAARVVGAFGAEQPFETFLARTLVRRAADSPVIPKLKALAPSVLMAMNPWGDVQLEMAAAAQRLSIPTIAFVTSWDNLSTKGRLVLDYDRYLVWSESMREELQRFYPRIPSDRITVVGAPQGDLFFQPQFGQTREQWCRDNGLDPRRPVVVYCLGSPNFFKEDCGLAPFMEALAARPELSAVQVVVRLHPGFRESGYTSLPAFRARYPHVRVQGALSDEQPVAFQLPHEIASFVNTVRHADVLINLASTITVDAAVCDRPIVNLDFDPEPGAPNQTIVRAVYRSWNHFSPLTKCDGFWLARDMPDAVTAVAQYLSTPTLHSEGRRRIAAHVYGPVDGAAGMRMAAAVSDVVAAREHRR